MPLLNDSLPRLLAAQGQDGGWGYTQGETSWTEPTACALLALLTDPKYPLPLERGLAWLRKTRRQDGGWAPNPKVEESTWVSALVVLVLAQQTVISASHPAVKWLLSQTGQEFSLVSRARRVLLGVRPDYKEEHAGWPWFPGTAAWVVPTALTILALQRVTEPTPLILDRLDEGRKFLLARTCRDGGWNHGASRTLGYETDSYPETTGLALLALRGVAVPDRAIACAERHLHNCRSTYALSWLQLGLLAHGRPVKQVSTGPARNAVDLSLSIIATAAIQGRGTVFQTVGVK